MAKDRLMQATRHLPCSVVIVSASDGERSGAMTASAMYISEDPPLVTVSVAKSVNNYALIEKSGEFAINIISDSQVEMARKLGKMHGFLKDKLGLNNVQLEPAEAIKSPVMRDCYANLECRVKTSLSDTESNHALYIGEVVAFNVNADLAPLVWLNNRYFKVGNECQI